MNTEAQDLQIKIADMESKQGQPEFNEFKLNAWKSRLAEIKSSQEQVETAVAAAQEDLDASFDSIDIGDGEAVSLRSLADNEAAYQVISIFFKTKIAGVVEKAAQEALAIKASYQEEIQELRASELEKSNELKMLREVNDKLGLDNADLQAKRDAAAAEIIELKQEVDRLSTEVEKLRTATSNTTSPSNTSADVAKTVKDWKNSRKPIVNIRWKDELGRKFYLAEDAKTGETIEIPRLEIGKYREVTAEEAAQFRSEAEHAPESNGAGQEAPVPTSPPLVIAPPEMQFPTTVPDEDPTGGLAEGDTGGEVAPKTLEERVAALEARVFGKVTESAA